MTIAEQNDAAKKFAEYWKGEGYEKGEANKLWLSSCESIMS